MVSLVQRALYGWVVGRPAKDLDAYVNRMREASEEECAQVLVATSVAAQWLQVTSMTKLRFPEVYLSGERPAELPEDKDVLSNYIAELIELRKAIRGEQAANAVMVNAGLMTLAHSIRCVRDADGLLAVGRALWGEILRGQAIAVEMTDALFVPRLLAPDWKPPLGWHLGYAAELARRSPRTPRQGPA
ncbi:hypothetical protein [Rhodoligotrophos defluvii]|uniref:hypothetical protein n=1 Tax=Rhodoligotrophos defluvii TaxID=2561934 RepID=UPI0010C9BF7C|nr:hypothetical protein [Rhodoligotrophos defluvii]